MLAGTRYTPSGKFEIINALIALAITVPLAALSGMLYAVITHINPLIYLNFLLLAGEVVLLAMLVMLVKALGKSRNDYLNFGTAAFICLVGWLAHWSFYMAQYYDTSTFNNLFHPGRVIGFVIEYANGHSLSVGRLGSKGMPVSGGFLVILYFIEFAAFMAPVYFAMKTDYYCEDCKRFYSSKPGFTEHIDEFNSGFGIREEGNYSFLDTIPMKNSFHELKLDPSDKPEIVKVEYHYCDKCRQNSIVDLSTAVLRYDDKNRKELAKENKFIEGMYIDKKTDEILERKLLISDLMQHASLAN